MKKLLFIPAIISLTVLTGCGVNPEAAKRNLEAQGMTNVEIGGYPIWGCSDRDGAWRSKFTATGANGQQVSGVLCEGLFKGMTVRYD